MGSSGEQSRAAGARLAICGENNSLYTLYPSFVHPSSALHGDPSSALHGGHYLICTADTSCGGRRTLLLHDRPSLLLLAGRTAAFIYK